MRRRRQPWDLERVIHEIRALHSVGELTTSSVLATSGHRDLVDAAIRYAGGWLKALRLAGVENIPGRKRWTRERVIAEIKERRRRGESLAATNLPHGLNIAAQRLFGSWRNARREAVPGFVEPYARWTRDAVVERLRARRARGDSLACQDVRASEDAPLVNAAFRLFGSWDAALHEAIDDHVSRRSWDRDAVVAELRRRHSARRSVNAATVQRDDPALVNAAREHFGRWRYALEAARVLTSVNREAWSRELVVERLRELETHQDRITARLAGASLTQAAQRLFGSFRAACEAAGRGSSRRRRR